MSPRPYCSFEGTCVGSNSSGIGSLFFVPILSVDSRMPYGANSSKGSLICTTLSSRMNESNPLVCLIIQTIKNYQYSHRISKSTVGGMVIFK